MSWPGRQLWITSLIKVVGIQVVKYLVEIKKLLIVWASKKLTFEYHFLNSWHACLVFKYHCVRIN